MFKFFAWVIGVPVIVIAIFFAISNQEAVVLDMWPTQYTFEMPLFWAVEGALLIGCVIGAFLTWLSNGRGRAEVRRYRRDLNTTRRELARAESRLKEAGGN